MNVAAVAVFVTLSGCYFEYPKNVPKLNGALVVEGERIELSSRSVVKYGTCTDYDYNHNECEIIHAKLVHPYTVYYAKATYAGRTLTRAEFMELAVADYPDRIRGIQDRKATCAVSLVPSVLAVAIAAGAYLVPLMMADRFTDDQKEKIYYGGAAVAAGSALLSYPLGGYACVKAKKLAGDLLVGADRHEWAGDGPDDFAPLEKLAEAFNAKHAHGDAAASAEN